MMLIDPKIHDDWVASSNAPMKRNTPVNFFRSLFIFLVLIPIALAVVFNIYLYN